MVDKFTVLILAIEASLCGIIIAMVPYTEIDWKAYMQEVGGFESGERDYKLLGGDTGPLVYPAGFLYIFYVFKKITDGGRNIAAAQTLFACVYLTVTFFVLRLYNLGNKVPRWIWFVLVLSKRVHSIFVLRCFNDCVAVLLGYLAILHLVKHKWRIGCVFYSLAVSVKMNMLLYAPGVLLVLLLGTSGVEETAVCLAICASVQLLLGAPFLTTYPLSYLSRSFDLGRTFEYKWTVNLKFLPEEVFISKHLSLALLACTLLAYTLFGFKWVRETWARIQQRRGKATKLLGMDSPSFLIGIGNLSPHYILVTLFTSNFIGVALARTLHYQFYVWYWHTLPYLLWHADLPAPAKLAILPAIELAFNVFPATAWSSALLQAAHMALLLGLYLTPVPFALFENNSTLKKKQEAATKAE
jgi:alpha-1,3-mannosyltransferase